MSRRSLAGCFCAVAAALAVAPPAQARPDLYGWQTTGSFNTWGLVRWRDPPSGGTVRIGAANDLSFDPAFSPAGVLYGTDGDNVFTINTTTGFTGAHVPVTGGVFGPNEFLIGLTFAPFGRMFGWTLNDTSSGIYTIDPQTGVAAAVTHNTPDTLFGMTFGPDGTLYASNGFDLLSLDPSTGTILQTIGSFPQFITSLGYGPDGVLRGLRPRFPGTDLYRVNPLNASLTFLGSSAEDIYGIASIPAPAGLFVLAAIGMAHRRRRPASLAAR